LKNFKLWSVFKLLDPDLDPGEPIIYGSDWIRIRNTGGIIDPLQELCATRGPAEAAGRPGESRRSAHHRHASAFSYPKGEEKQALDNI